MRFADLLQLVDGARLRGLLTPLNDDEPAPKGYVDTAIAGVTTSTEAVQDIVGALIADSATLDATYNDAGNLESLAVLDSPTVAGQTPTQIIAAAIAGVVDSAPGTLNTLDELAAALGDDANFAATVTAALAARVQQYDTTVGDGAATTYTITHNLNTKKVSVEVYQTATPWETTTATVRRPTVNTITLTFAQAPAAGYYTVVVQGKPGA